MKLTNASRNIVLADSVEVAQTFSSRTRGLLGRVMMPPGTALVIRPCNSIHTFFMQFPIDVMFVSSAGVIVGILKNLPPWRLSPLLWQSAYVIELPAGVLAATSTQSGDQILIL
jgi:uncharacterized protein